MPIRLPVLFALMLAGCAGGKTTVGPEAGDDTGATPRETGGNPDETGQETGGDPHETGQETGGDSGAETGGEGSGGDDSASPDALPESSRCIVDTDTIGACTSGVYATDWSGDVRYEWAVTDGYNHSALVAIEGGVRTPVASIVTTSSWHLTGGLTVMPDGDLVLAGITLPYVTLTINDDDVSLGSDYVRFIARISPEGDIRWVQTIVGISSEPIVVAARADGSTLVSGYVYYTTDFDTTTISTSTFFERSFVAALSEDGDWLWATAADVPAGVYSRTVFGDMVETDDGGATVTLRLAGAVEVSSGTVTCTPTGTYCDGTATVSADGEWTDLVLR